MLQIIEIVSYKAVYLEAVQRLLDQLTSSPMVLTEEMLKQTICSPNSHLFFLMEEEQVAGMITVGVYASPTGGKAWIEDVVVDRAFRGRGLGRLLVDHAIAFVKQQGIPSLMLTSNPKRVAANQLYQALGFGRKETNVYKMNL